MNWHLFAFTKTLSTKGVFTFLFLCLISVASGQAGNEKGKPFVKNYSPELYDGLNTNWSVIQGDDGIMYFGNPTAESDILQYDGVHWTKIDAIGKALINRCFKKGENGIIYYGASGNFGYLAPDSLGKTAEFSLSKYIPKNKQDFTDVWSIQIAGKDIYFQSRERLFRLTKSGDKWVTKTWDPSTHFMYSFYLDGVLYIHEQGKGLFKMINDSLVLIPRSEFLGKERMQIMLPYNEKLIEKSGSNSSEYLVGTFTHGLYIFDGKDFKPFATAADSLFKNTLLYKGMKLNGNYALSILGRGVVIIDPHGKIKQIINKNTGLASDIVYDFVIGKRGSFWLATDNGISKVDINSPFTTFNSQSGISAAPLSMARLPDGTLYVGSNNGLLRYNPAADNFQMVNQIPRDQIFTVIADGNTLLIPANGLYMIKEGKAALVEPSVNDSLKLSHLFLSKKYPGLLYGATTFGLTLFVRDLSKTTGWKYLGYFPKAPANIFGIAEDENGRTWAGSQNGEAIRVTPFFDENGQPDITKSKIETFGKEQGLKGFYSRLFSLNHRIYFLTDSATLTYDELKKHFVPASLFGKHFFAGKGDSTGKITLASFHNLNQVSTLLIATPGSSGKYDIDSTSLMPIINLVGGGDYHEIHDNDIVWFFGNDELIRFDSKIKANADQSYKTLITAITSQKNSLNPFEDTGNNLPEINFKNNALRFEYAAPFYQSEDKTEYQTWLEGYEKTWSDWGKNTYKEYTNLSPGKYTFHVRAKNLYHKISEASVYPFIVLVPWYSTWWAYLLYALGAIFLIYFFIKYRTRQLKEKHKELEKTIHERTAELSARVEELAVINNVQEGLVSKLDMQSIYDLVGNKIRDAFDAQVVLIGSFDENNGLEHFNYTIENGKRYYPDGRPLDKLRKKLIETKQKIVIRNIDESFKWFGNKTIGDTGSVKSAIFVPLLIGDKVKRYVSLQNVDRENSFSDSDVRLLETLANSMSVALENARLFDETTRLLKETEQRTAELSVINSVQEGLAKELNMHAIYELVGNKLSDVLHTLDIDIRLFSAATNQVFYPYVRDHGKIIKVEPSLLSGMSKYVYETHQTLIINEKLEERMKELGSVILPGTQMEKSFMAVPIIVGDKVLGMVSISNYEKENAFSESEVRLLQTVVSAMSVALENARLFDETNRLLKETEQRTAELGVINSVQDGLVREMNMAAIYELVGNRLCDLFPDTQTLVIRTFDHSTGLEHWQYAIEKGVRLHTEPRPLNWINKELITTKTAININENFVETARKFGGATVTVGMPPKSVIFVPMIVGDVVKGSVSLQNVDRENAFNDSDVRLLTTLTNSMSVALENARLFDETTRLLADAKQRASELTTVNNISKALASQLNPNELIQFVGDQLRDLFSANIAYLALLNKKTKMIYFPYQFGEIMPARKIGDGLTSKIIMSGEPLLINKDLSIKHEEMGISQMGTPASSYLGVPIPEGDEIIGVLSVQSTEQENRFNENDQRLLTTIASSVGVALRNAQLFEDVEQAKMEAEKASKIAEKANEAKSAFLSTVSHELRTPLTSVLGFAKIINKRLNDKIFPAVDQSDPKTGKTITQINENLQVVISEGERLTHLINDVLDLAKIEAGRMEWNQENVSLAEVVERAVLATTSLFDQKGIKLIKKIDNNLPDIIGDPDKLIQVVINLFSNAVKFTEKGNVTCEVSQKDSEVIVSVSDTGIGIAPEDYGAVFEQFKQVGGDTLTDKPKGTGLGLPICKEIVEHHSGRIWVESKIGKGSTFSFAIPFVQSDNKKQKPIHLDELVKQLKVQMVFSQLKSNGKMASILVVDDDDSIRSLLDQELSEAGYLIEQATNGKHALECIRKNRPDLIILDVMMPEMNGFDVAAILKNDPQTMDIPIIILSIVQDKARGFRIGVDRYLTKPIDTAQLFTEVGNLLEQGKSKRKVMVVDEDSAAVRSLTDVLQTKGYQVVESDGKELVKNAIASQPDIIILNSILSGNQEIVKTLRFEKGLENVLFFIYQ
jgi:signal transduction histidine kinase/CheY-like chemotaxis protein